MPKEIFVFDANNLNATYCYLHDASVTTSEKKKELRKLHPINFALLYQYIETKIGFDAVTFFKNIYDLK